MSETLPLFSFPATIMLVDDNASFLASLGLELGDEQPRILYSEPGRALQDLQERQSLYQNLERFLKTITSEQFDDDSFSTQLDYQAVFKLLFEPKRFEEVFAVLVDYSMPGMNGIEFCQQIADLPVKKIMVTGAADYKIAVEAFNKGIIDRFIVKDTNMMAELKKNLVELKFEYFSDLSTAIAGKASSHLRSNTVCQTVISKLIDKHNIIEYYQIDYAGSYLGLDKQGKFIWFVVTTEEQMNDYIDIAKEGGLDQQNIEKLEKRTHCVFFIFRCREKTSN